MRRRAHRNRAVAGGSLCPDDARAGDNRALQYACGGGHLATAQWLVDYFALTADDARAGDNSALRLAKRYTGIVDWLFRVETLPDGTLALQQGADSCGEIILKKLVFGFFFLNRVQIAFFQIKPKPKSSHLISTQTPNSKTSQTQTHSSFKRKTASLKCASSLGEPWRLLRLQGQLPLVWQLG
jgi:hypothetical protein